ncbi:stage II sporulation protein M [Chengkuizengella axinellae]|uniref:Stage II sporulation protein M n=1 Tax=Chengkuizengella axinellae TaxID=3064388 RepID=A0ABT9J5N0_9BACL|nr:stage II sporulation protein M [Chengkuizengella sp. 2205SS18-9]MDP5276921.1 stage II sporulation protein M [Chengkuizengella sp. 2205SS18-9]
MTDKENVKNEMDEQINKEIGSDHKNESNFIRDVFNFKTLFRNFKEMKVYFFISTMLFLFGGFIGFYVDILDPFLQPLLQRIGELAEKIESSENTQLAAFLVIFQNNLTASLIMVYSGIIFSIYPIFALLLNGMLIGYLFKLVPQSGSEYGLLELFLRGILPHGILEIPAILIASAYGIKFGVLVMKWLAQFVELDLRRKNTLEFKKFLKLTITLVIFTFITLMLAAIIESTITPMLLR